MRPLTLGGIHPAPHKELTRKKPLAQLDFPPAEVVLHMDMSSGAPAVPIVAVGDRVRMGQMIATANGEFSAPIHASVSGVVTAIEPRPHPLGEDSLAVVIANDGKGTVFPVKAPRDYRNLSQEELLGWIRISGVVGMGGSAMPAHEKILAARGRADTLIINAAECEPYLTADHRLLLERGRQIMDGARILTRVLGVNRTIIASSGDKLNAIERLERTVGKDEVKIRLRTIPTRFPLGEERLITRVITGREVPPGGNPTDVGCVVFNVATVYAIGLAVRKGTPLTHRVVTVTGGSVVRPRNLWVPIGTSLKCVLESVSGWKEKPALVLLGGPMTGILQQNMEVPILKNTGGLVCMAPWEVPPQRSETPCLQCGHCIVACPMRLSPVFIQRALETGDMKKLADLHPEDCMECGGCNYSCPCRIRLLDRVRRAKELLRQREEGLS